MDTSLAPSASAQNRTAPPFQFLSWLLAWLKPARAPLNVSHDRPFCFLHIPKTAGMTVRQFLTIRFPPEDVYNVAQNPAHSPDLPAVGDDLFELHQRRPHLAYISHVPYHWLRHFPQKPYRFTILREPIDRALSHYYFLRELVRLGLLPYSHPLLDRVAEVEIDVFVREEFERSRVFFGELQTRWFLGGPCWELQDYDPACFPRLTRADLRRAKRRLRECFVVGLAHRLLESLQFLAEAFDWPLPDSVGRENATASRPTKDQLDPQTVRLLEEITAFDRELFAEGTRIFEKQVANRGKTWRRRSPVPASFECCFDQGVPGSGWFFPERDSERWYCWTEETAWLEFAMQPVSRVEIDVELHHVFGVALSEQLEVELNGQRIDGTLTHSGGAGPARFRSILESPNLIAPPEKNRLTFRVPETIRPSEVMFGHSDTRPLGVAVSRVVVRPAGESSSLEPVVAPTSFACVFDQGIPGYGWLVPERGVDRWYCWTGKVASLEFALRRAERVEIDIRQYHALAPIQCEQLEIDLNEQRIDRSLTRTNEGDGNWRYFGVIDSPNLVLAPRRNRLTFRLPGTLRPCEVMEGHPDGRSLGLAFSRVEVRAA